MPSDSMGGPVTGITGHRPSRIPDPDWVKDVLADIFTRSGSSLVLQGMADGADMWAAAVAWRCGIPFVGVRPWRGHQQPGPGYDWCLRNAQEIVETDPSDTYPGPWAYQRRNEWIVDHCDELVAVWDGKENGGTWRTVQYAMKNRLGIIQVNPTSRTVTRIPAEPDDDHQPSLLDF